MENANIYEEENLKYPTADNKDDKGQKKLEIEYD